jgi:hypothetical protein
MTLDAGTLDNATAATVTSFGTHGSRLRAYGQNGSNASAAWPSANAALLIPFAIAVPTTFTGAFFVAGTSPGTATFDLGIYRDDFTRVASLNLQSAVNTTGAVLPVGGGSFASPVTVPRGRYFMAMSAAATSITAHAVVPGNQVLRALGMFTATSSHPLPATITPASMGTTAYFPMMGLTTTANAVL